MNGFTFQLALCVVVVLAGGLISHADAACTGASPTWTSSADRASVSTCVNNAKNGDTINVQAGSTSWSSNIDIDGKNIRVIGAGAGQTIIAGNAFKFNNAASRISGFTFNLSCGSMFVIEASIGWRIDHNTINVGGSTCYDVWLQTYGQGTNLSEGLIDNNIINRGRIIHFGEDTGTGGRHTWAAPTGLGTSRAIYIEDNVITYPSPSAAGYLNHLDGNLGCRYVSRFNTINGGRYEAHSVQGDNTRACMLWEIYHETLTNPSGDPQYRPWLMRGGTGMIFHNTSDGGFQVNSIQLDNKRTTGNDILGQVPNWKLCDGNSWVDGNSSGGQGYPCRDQIGRSTDASLWNYGQPAPAQAHVPAYIWRNTQPGGEMSVTLNTGSGTSQQVTRQSTMHIVESRDYYTYRSSFNGTAGVGEGPLSSRPSTCTVGVGYWATDQGEWNSKKSGPDGQLYRCTATNTWSLYYVPYAYPHPLQQGGGSNPTTPAAPTNLRIVP